MGCVVLHSEKLFFPSVRMKSKELYVTRNKMWIVNCRLYLSEYTSALETWSDCLMRKTAILMLPLFFNFRTWGRVEFQCHAAQGPRCYRKPRWTVETDGDRCWQDPRDTFVRKSIMRRKLAPMIPDYLVRGNALLFPMSPLMPHHILKTSS